MATVLPPPFSPADPPPPHPDAGADLPSYHQSVRRVSSPSFDHTYSILDRDKPWIQLKFKSHAPSAKSVPIFFSGDSINGTVETNFKSSETVQSIDLAVLGETTTVGEDPITFFRVNVPIHPSAANPGTKLQGQLKWPISIQLAKEVAVDVNGAQKSYPLPPSFSMTGCPAFIEYKLVLTVRRGKFKADKIISQTIACFSRSRAGTPSDLRRLHYLENMPLVGPEADPEGWVVLAPATVKGTLFATRPIELECTLAIAKPLSFAKGTVIPLIYTVKVTGEDTQALDLLCVPSAIPVRLNRLVSINADPEEGLPHKMFGGTVCLGQVWPSRETYGDRHVRKLEGEIHIAKECKPSFSFPRCSLEYSVAILPFKAAGFEPADPAPLFSQVVQVTSDLPLGPPPRSNAPPGIEQPEPFHDFNVVQGLLHTANQRYLHHAHV